MRLFMAVLCVSVVASTSSAAVFSGRATVSSYAWTRTETDSTDTQHIQNSGTLGLKLARIGGKDLEIATTLRGTYDKRNRGDNVDDYRVYDLYARWRKIAGAADIIVGRHRVNWPSGSIGIDGATADLSFFKGWEIGAYVGSLTPLDGHFQSTTYEDGHAFGARIGHRSRSLGTLYLVFSERREARSYAELDLNTLAARTLSLDWRRPVVGFGSLYAHLMYDEPRREVARAQLTARWDVAPTVSLQGEYRFRKPSIAYNSIFWVFGNSDYSEGRARLVWRVNSNWSVTAGGALVSLADDEAQRIDLGVSHKYVSLLLNLKSGAPGKTVGLTGDVMYPVSPHWLLRGGANYSSFELIDEQADASTQSSFWGGVRWQAMAMASVDLEAQLLTQDLKTMANFTGDDSDLRFIARLSWWFFQRTGKPGGGA